MSTVVDEALAMPVEKRAELANLLLQSLNPANTEIEQAWAKEAEARLAAYQSGQLKAVDARQSLEQIRSRLK
jgi:putative addiction module component (TIGR02574 family)